MGAMTSELKPSHYIEEFVSGGPKNYAYRIVDPAAGNRAKVCKFRGITLNFDVIEYVILRGDETKKFTVHTE